MAIEVVSVHVPKTGGMSFLDALRQVYGEEAVFPDNGEYTGMEIAAMPLKPWHRVIHGHVWAGRYRRRLPDARMVTWLRHPVDWLISLYLFLDSLEQADNPAWTLLKTKQPSLLEFAASDAVQLQAPHRFLEGVPLGDFFFVGLQEQFEDDLRNLEQMMEWKTVEVPQINRNPAGVTVRTGVWADPALVNGLCDRLEKDMQLYEAAQVLRKSRQQNPSDVGRDDS